MKPKTKLQKQIVRLSKQLKPHKVALKKWGLSLHDKYFLTAYQRMHYCLACGHKWKGSLVEQSHIIGDVDCPSCKCNLQDGNRLSRKHTLRTDSQYLAKIESINEFQVVRFFWSEKIMRKNIKERYSVTEIMQHWITPKGRIVTLAKSVNGYSHYYDMWQWHTNLEIRTMSHGMSMRQELMPSHIYPDIGYTSLLYRNGFRGNVQNCNPHFLFSMLLKSNIIESLWKQGKYKLVEFAIRKGEEDIIKYSNQIRIAHNNNYEIKNFKLWSDYLYMANELGRDINSPKHVCPKNLKRSHDNVSNKITIIRRKEKLKEQIERMKEDNILYTKRIKKYSKLKFVFGDLVITTIKTIQDIQKEAQELQHCVFSGGYHKKENSLLLSAKIKNKHIETIEISLLRAKILQARGKNNKPSKHNEQIKFLIDKNMNKIMKIK